MKGVIKAICISERKGTRKHPVPCAVLEENHGILGDAHAGTNHRQVSLLANESVDKMRVKGVELNAGDFAENIVTEGIELKTLPVGTQLQIGEAELEVTQIGKKCHNDCEIRRLTGECVMPTEGIFAIVLQGGQLRPGDSIKIKGETDEID